MKKYFTYTKSADESFNSLVDCGVDLARRCYEGNKGADYEEKNRELLNGIGKKSVEGTRYEVEFENEGLKLFERQMVRNNSTVRDNFNAVIAQIINVIVPETVND